MFHSDNMKSTDLTSFDLFLLTLNYAATQKNIFKNFIIYLWSINFIVPDF